MKAGKCDDCIAETAEPVDQNAFDVALHCGIEIQMLSCSVCA
jgi:hypothetical protein